MLPLWKLNNTRDPKQQLVGSRRINIKKQKNSQHYKVKIPVVYNQILIN